MGAVTTSNLDDVFSYHKPKNDFQIEKYHRIRQAAKAAAKVVLDTTDAEARGKAIEELRSKLIAETDGDCRDAQEAMGMLDAAKGFSGALAAALSGDDPNTPEAEAQGTQAVIAAIRGAVMWANASVALEGRV